MGETVTVTIDKSGHVVVEAHGVQGSGCQALTKPMRDALGVSTDERRKPEFLQEAEQAQSAWAGR